MLRYEASLGLRNAILDNWLLNIKGELGKWLPADLHQEHYNKWLEDMIQRHGGEFDSQFYRQTISPNVQHFLHIKKEVETAFSLERRGQTHTAPHLRSELHLLLTTFKDEEIHLFRSGRSQGHAAVNQFARGWRRLEEGKLSEFLTKSTVLGDFLQEVRNPDGDSEMRSDSPTPSVPSSDSTDSSSTSSSSSAQTSSSMRSMADIDPNEPDDDGEDLSDAKLDSGSTGTMFADPGTGSLVMESEDWDEEDNSDDGEEEPCEEEEDEPEAEVSEDEDEDEN